jgi:CubicO group peptidase (beta-lactamase class C family)
MKRKNEHFNYSSQPEEIGLSSERLEQAYGLFENAVTKRSLMGAAIQVSRGGVALKPRCFGRKELEFGGTSVEPETIFLVASVTKPVTATAAMLLVEKGKLYLDETVSSLIPEFRGKDKEKVLVRHLFTHTSGLPDQLAENQQLRTEHAPLKEFIRRICKVELLFQPGTNVSYQSCGLAMLSEIVERIEGISLREFMRREIFEPLGMKDTSLGARKDNMERISQIKIPDGAFQYGSTEVDWNWNSLYWWNFGAPWGGMFTTIEDMTTFCQMFLNNGRFGDSRILSPTTVAAMTTDQTAAMPNIPNHVKIANRWGLGWRLRSFNSSTFGDLASQSTYGHSGATGTLVWIDPENQLTCVIFTNDPQGAGSLRPLASNIVASSIMSN